MFWSSLFGDTRKFATSSWQVLEAQWNSFRLKPALSTLYSKNEVKKTFRAEELRKCRKVSWFFAFFYNIFVVHLRCLEEKKWCSDVPSGPSPAYNLLNNKLTEGRKLPIKQLSSSNIKGILGNNFGYLVRQAFHKFTWNPTNCSLLSTLHNNNVPGQRLV